jgi:putative ABC transport system permease protein
MGGIMQDLRLAVRQMRKAPGFNLTAILTLALGMGATIAIFSLVEGILLRPLPFADPDRLVIVGDHVGNGPNPGVTAREIATYETATNAFSAMGGFNGTSYELSGGPTPELISGARLGAGAFSALGVAPMLGRVFTQQEDDGRQPLAGDRLCAVAESVQSRSAGAGAVDCAGPEGLFDHRSDAP